MKLYCDNKSAINIAHNPVHHDWTKHVEIDRHFIKEKLESGLICTPFVPSEDQLAYVLTKGLPSEQFQNIVSKLGMDDIHSPAWGGVLNDVYSRLYYYILVCVNVLVCVYVLESVNILESE